MAPLNECKGNGFPDHQPTMRSISAPCVLLCVDVLVSWCRASEHSKDNLGQCGLQVQRVNGEGKSEGPLY